MQTFYESIILSSKTVSPTNPRLQMLRELKAHPEFSSLPVVVLTLTRSATRC